MIENGVIRDTGDCLEMEDVYQKFFEDVLEVNEEINVSSVRDYISVLNENIDYYLKENNESRKYKYLKEVRRCLKTIALATLRNQENETPATEREVEEHISAHHRERTGDRYRSARLLLHGDGCADEKRSE